LEAGPDRAGPPRLRARPGPGGAVRLTETIENGPRPEPVLDIRVRWKAGQVALGLAAILTLLALLRPLATPGSIRLKLVYTVALGVGVTASALLASLRGRGRAETFALYAFLALSLDALGQLLSPLGWPLWPLLAVLVAALAVAERLAVAL